MSWLGKVVGGAFGFLMGGPLGAVLGAAFGHQLDQNGADLRLGVDDFGSDDPHRVQMTFFNATFSIMGHIAKSDGRVTETEIAFARDLMTRMDLTEDLKIAAMHLYNEGKHSEFCFDTALHDFYLACNEREILVRTFIEIQTASALADGPMGAKKEALLLNACEQLKFSRFEFHGIRTRLETERRFSSFNQKRHHQYQHRHYQATELKAPPVIQAYAILGLRSDATNHDLKQAYRKLISKHHPDKLISENLTEHQIKQANETTQKIQKAYDAICKSRNI
jgi:DnaJ like chaperone protein